MPLIAKAHRSYHVLPVFLTGAVFACAVLFLTDSLPAQPAPGAQNPPARQSNLKPGAPAVETNPAVLGILESNPQQLPEMMVAAQQLVQLGRPELAMLLLARIAAAGAPPDQLADLMERHGAAFFIRLASDESLQPVGAEVASLVSDAAAARLVDQGRIDQLIALLTGDDRTQQVLALDKLKQHGELAVLNLIGLLADAARADDHAVIQQALVQCGAMANGPLVGSLDSPDRAFQARLFWVLGQRRHDRGMLRMIAPAAVFPAGDELGDAARSSLQHVLGQLPSRQESETFIRRQLDRYLDGDLLLPTSIDGQIELWQWSSQDRQPIKRQYRAALVQLILAAQAATDLYSLDQDNREYELLYLRSILEASKSLNGLDEPLLGLGDDPDDPDRKITAGSIAESASAEMLMAVYRNSIKTDHVPAAVAAIEAMVVRGDQSLVISSSGQPTFLLEAIRHPDPRLRFVATQTIIKLDPQQPYPGSSFLLESLAYFASSRGTPRILTASGTAFRAQAWGGLLGTLGYDSDLAATGKEAFRLAAQHPDYSFILLGDTIARPELAETLSMLRKDPRTAQMPVAIVTDGNESGVGPRLAARDDRTILVFNPSSSDGMLEELRPLVAIANRQAVPSAVRLQHARFALKTIADLAGDSEKYGFYDISRHQEKLVAALFQPGMAEYVAPALGAVATPAAMQALLNFSSQGTQSLADRQTAVTALDNAIQKRGLLITRLEVQRQYQLYNASLETADDETVELLGSILDSIEGPFRRRQQASREAAAPGDEP